MAEGKAGARDESEAEHVLIGAALGECLCLFLSGGVGFCGGLESRWREGGFRRTGSSVEIVDELMSVSMSMC